jgi:hypothetical protein
MSKKNVFAIKKRMCFFETNSVLLRPFVRLSFRDIVSEIKRESSVDKIWQWRFFFTKICQSSLSFVKIGTLTAIIYL